MVASAVRRDALCTVLSLAVYTGLTPGTKLGVTATGITFYAPGTLQGATRFAANFFTWGGAGASHESLHLLSEPLCRAMKRYAGSEDPRMIALLDRALLGVESLKAVYEGQRKKSESYGNAKNGEEPGEGNEVQTLELCHRTALRAFNEANGRGIAATEKNREESVPHLEFCSHPGIWSDLEIDRILQEVSYAFALTNTREQIARRVEVLIATVKNKEIDYQEYIALRAATLHKDL